MNYEIKKEDWTVFFDGLTKRRYEWLTEVEVLSPSVGDQTLSAGLPLNGITVESKDDAITIAISIGETFGNHQTHRIMNPSRVAFLDPKGPGNEVVDIEEIDGTKTLIRLTEPIGLLVGMAAYEWKVAAA